MSGYNFDEGHTIGNSSYEKALVEMWTFSLSMGDQDNCQLPARYGDTVLFNFGGPIFV